MYSGTSVYKGNAGIIENCPFIQVFFIKTQMYVHQMEQGLLHSVLL